MAQLNDHAATNDLAKLLVCSKSDLEKKGEVESAGDFYRENRMETLQTSTTTGENVLRAFERLIHVVYKKTLESRQFMGIQR